MRIYLARHGQTGWNGEGRWQGNKDTALDALGLEQARRLGARLAGLGIGKIYSSPLKRAAATAETVGGAIDAPVVLRGGLREVRLGQWEGMTTREIEARYGGLFAEWEQNPAARVGLGVENLNDLRGRAYEEFCAMAEAETEDFLAVVHGTWLKCLICRLMDIPLESRFGFRADNTGVTVAECVKGGGAARFEVVTLNDISHLR